MLVDANLLLLLVVGAADREYISAHRNLKAYTQADFDLLSELLGPDIARVVVLPNIVTEVSDLAGQIHTAARRRIGQAMAAFMQLSNERFIASADAVGHATFLHLGLTDAAILLAAAQPGTAITILTTDLDLAIEAEMAGLPVVNFNHLRP